MKHNMITIMALSAIIVSAQNNNDMPSATIDTVPNVTQNNPPSPSACAVQSTFELCLENEDKYINTCQEQDYACLCRWHKEKLTCWNNCPNDGGISSQAAIVLSLCSMPGANVTIAPWTSSIVSTPTPIRATSIIASSALPVPTTPNNTTSVASMFAISQGVIGLLCAVTAAMFF